MLTIISNSNKYDGIMGISGGPVVKNPPANAGDTRDVGLIPGLGRSPGGENGTPLHYSCLKKKKSHKQRSLAGYSPTGCKELDMNEQLSMCLLWFSRVQLSATQWTAAHEAALSPGVCSNSCPVSRWCHPTISSSVDITSLQGSYLFYSELLFYSYCPTEMFHWDR